MTYKLETGPISNLNVTTQFLKLVWSMFIVAAASALGDCVSAWMAVRQEKSNQENDT